MKNQHDLAESWFRKADSDLTVARVLIDTENAYDSVCFHAQQAVEKYMKGFIEMNKQIAPKVHNLVKLNNICAELGAPWKLSTDWLSEMTDYAVQSRYELNFYPDRDTAIKALQAAQQICSIILAAQRTIKAEDHSPQ